MNQLKTDIETLLTKSCDVTFEENRIFGSIVLNDRSIIDLVGKLEGGNSFGISFKFDSLTMQFGSTVPFEISLSLNELIYASYQNFISHALRGILSFSKVREYFIFEEFYNSFKIADYKSKIAPLISIFSLLKCLANKYYFTNDQVIIFSKSHCEISFQLNNFEKYIELADECNRSETLTHAISSFAEWLSASSNSIDENIKKSLEVHENERYAIAASEFVNSLSTYDKNVRVFKLLKNTDAIYQSILSKYYLYLDDFKYSKFNEKIASYADEFLIKVENTLSDLQTQVLAIPLAASILATFPAAAELNVVVFGAFLVYTLMVFYATAQQYSNLILIKTQISDFKTENNIPSELLGKWEKEIKPIDSKIKSHRIYIAVVLLFIISVMWFCWNYLVKHLLIDSTFYNDLIELLLKI